MWLTRSFVVPLVLLWGPAAGQLHFASIANFGVGPRSSQKVTASKLKAAATADSISFVVSPGSNFHRGVTGVNDSKWDSRFQDIYGGDSDDSSLHLPFFSVVGSEDWAGNHSALMDYSNSTLRGQSGLVAAEVTDETEGEGSNLQVAAGRLNASLYAEASPSSDRRNPGHDEQSGGPRWTLPNYWYHYATHFRDASDSGLIKSAATSSVAFLFIDTEILSGEFPFSNITELHFNTLRADLQHACRAYDWVIVVGDKDYRANNRLEKVLDEYPVDLYLHGENSVHYSPPSANDTTSGGAGSVALASCGSGTGFCIHTLYKDRLTTRLVAADRSERSYTQMRRAKSVDWLHRFRQAQNLSPVAYVEIPAMGAVPPRDADPFVRVVGTLGICFAASAVLFNLVRGAVYLVRPDLLRPRAEPKQPLVGGSPDRLRHVEEEEIGVVDDAHYQPHIERHSQDDPYFAQPSEERRGGDASPPAAARDPRLELTQSGSHSVTQALLE